jgi:hypothetical protein
MSQDTRHRQIAQAVKWRNHGHLVVRVGVLSGLRPTKGSRQSATRHSVEHALTRRHRPLSRLLEVLPGDIR